MTDPIPIDNNRVLQTIMVGLMNFFDGSHINRITIGLTNKFGWTYAFFMGRTPVSTDQKFFRNTRLYWRWVILQNLLSRRPSTVWLWWFRNNYILLNIDSIELLILLVSVVSCSPVLAMLCLLQCSWSNNCIACNTLVAFEIAPGINMNATKL